MIKKRRKPRTDPRNNLNFDGSHMFGWPYTVSTPAAKKLRLAAGLCLGCGEKECRCKSKS